MLEREWAKTAPLKMTDITRAGQSAVIYFRAYRSGDGQGYSPLWVTVKNIRAGMRVTNFESWY